MCTFNGAQFLREQLDSFERQSRLPDELVVCDDHSTDASWAVLQDFARHASFPVRLHRNDANLGFQRNFEQAIGWCHGEFVALSDQDDVWSPHKLSRLLDVLQSDVQVGLVFSNAELVDEHLRPMGRDLWTALHFSKRLQRKIRSGDPFPVLLRPRLIGASMMFRSTFKPLVLPIPLGTGWSHDLWIASLIAAVAPVALVDECLIQYRQHGYNYFGAPPRTHVTTLASSPVDAVARIQSYHYRAAAIEQLLDRLQAHEREWPPSASARQTANARAMHYSVRGSMPRSRVGRIPLIIKELVMLRYRRHSEGIWSAGRDLLQPAPRSGGGA